MTTFQLVLVGLGIALVLAVVLYNWLQERRYRREASQGLSDLRDEILLDQGTGADAGARRIEPHIHFPEGQANEPDSLGEIRASTAQRSQEPTDAYLAQGSDVLSEAPGMEAVHRENRSGEADSDEPVGMPFVVEELKPRIVAPNDAVPERGVSEAPSPVTQAAQAFTQESPLDIQTEYIARLRFSHPVTTPLAALLDALRHIGKPVRAMGKREDGVWEAVVGPGRESYTALELGLQLADRSGAASLNQIEAFCSTLYEFAAEHGGAVSCPDQEAALEEAQALDLFCIEVDVLIGLNVVAPDGRPFRMADILRLAAEAGMTLQADGTYALRNPQGATLYTLSNQAEQPFQAGDESGLTHGVTLLFDIPTVADGSRVFDQMAGLGNRMASTLGGHLVDDNGKHVSQDSLQKIRERLAEAYASMAARGIPAGGDRARRLFV